MKVVVIGGTGLIGTKLTNKLRSSGHEVIAASPSSGVNTIIGEGLDAAIGGAQVVVDVSNSSQFEDRTVLEFFATSVRNLLAAEHRAGVKHHVVLSVVGTDRVQRSSYFHAKLAQEDEVKKSGLMYSIVRSTQFFEFIDFIADSATSEDLIQLPPVAFQPVAADDVVNLLVDVVLGTPIGGTIEIAGPKRSTLVELTQHYLTVSNDLRKVIANIHARYFGAELNDQSLVPGSDARIGSTQFETWLNSLRTPRPGAITSFALSAS